MNTGKQTTGGKTVRGAFRRLGRILLYIWIVLSVMVSIGCLISANGGKINPMVWAAPAIAAMTFPFWLVANIICGLVNLRLCRPAAVLQLAALLGSAGGILAICPLNIFHSSPTTEELESPATFTIMSFNTCAFDDYQNRYPNNTNRSASAIISSGADIVCLQETVEIAAARLSSITPAQIDSINSIYPYIAHDSYNERMVTVLSKYPLREIDLDQPQFSGAGYQGALADINGTEILIVSVHLQSIGLSETDRKIYRSLTDITSDTAVSYTEAGKFFYGKLTDAFRRRTVQAMSLCEQIKAIGSENIIISGDFNDINGCYAMRLLMNEFDMSDAFSSVYTGPMITYHADHFFFNIDHILYTNHIRCLDFRRGNLKSSDHYPIYATFTIKK